MGQTLVADEDKQARQQVLQQSLARAKELYLEGDLERVEYERRRTLYREQLADLTNTPYNAIIASGYLIANFPALWEKEDKNLQKKLLRALLAAITVQGNALTAYQPNSACYPLLKYALPLFGEKACHSGSDGT